MSWDDEHFIGGNVALDFANTVFRRRPRLGNDLFTDTAVLAAWFRHAEVITREQERVLCQYGSDAVLTEARGLRGLLWDLFDARSEGRDLPAAALAAVLDVAGRGLADRGVAVSAAGSPIVLDPRRSRAAVALHAVALTLPPDGPPIRTCDRCGWFFLDSSRGRRRRWCSMRTCGNQAKAARYRSAHA
ncbi:CGNR zinc finger domain-containing protein [Actinomycetes bacterium KLBMP 9759]